MFCPSCGSNEQVSQFCRACGTDLRTVRTTLERPDSITASAVTAREEIGRAVAEKIREVDDARDLKRVAEDVLPQIEKFLESPEEKRLRRVRAGVIAAAVGLGVGVPTLVGTAVVASNDVAMFLLMLLALATVSFVVGLGLVLNGLVFTRPRKGLEDHSHDAQAQNLLDAGYAAPQLQSGAEGQPLLRSQTTSELSRAGGSSVTEHTTHLLKTER